MNDFMNPTPNANADPNPTPAIYVPGRTMPIENFTKEVQRQVIQSQFGINPTADNPTLPEGMSLVKTSDLESMKAKSEMLNSPEAIEALGRRILPDIFNAPTTPPGPHYPTNPVVPTAPAAGPTNAAPPPVMPTNAPNANPNDFFANWLNPNENPPNPNDTQPPAPGVPIAPVATNPLDNPNPNVQAPNPNITPPAMNTPGSIQQGINDYKKSLATIAMQKNLPVQDIMNTINGWSQDDLVVIAQAYINAKSASPNPPNPNNPTPRPSIMDLPTAPQQRTVQSVIQPTGKIDPNNFNI